MTASDRAARWRDLARDLVRDIAALTPIAYVDADALFPDLDKKARKAAEEAMDAALDEAISDAIAPLVERAQRAIWLAEMGEAP